MDVEKMRRVLEAVTQQKPLAQEDWPKGREEWDWLMSKTCNVYYLNEWNGHKNQTLKKAVSVMVEAFLKFVDKGYPEVDEESPKRESYYWNMERAEYLRLEIKAFAWHCAEEYLVQMPEAELEAWKTLVRVDPDYRIQIWGGFKMNTAVTDNFVMNDTIEHLLRKREAMMKETRFYAHWFYNGVSTPKQE